MKATFISAGGSSGVNSHSVSRYFSPASHNNSLNALLYASWFLTVFIVSVSPPSASHGENIMPSKLSCPSTLSPTPVTHSASGISCVASLNTFTKEIIIFFIWQPFIVDIEKCYIEELLISSIDKLFCACQVAESRYNWGFLILFPEFIIQLCKVGCICIPVADVVYYPVAQYCIICYCIPEINFCEVNLIVFPELGII